MELHKNFELSFSQITSFLKDLEKEESSKEKEDQISKIGKNILLSLENIAENAKDLDRNTTVKICLDTRDLLNKINQIFKNFINHESSNTLNCILYELDQIENKSIHFNYYHESYNITEKYHLRDLASLSKAHRYSAETDLIEKLEKGESLSHKTLEAIIFHGANHEFLGKVIFYLKEQPSDLFVEKLFYLAFFNDDILVLNILYDKFKDSFENIFERLLLLVVRSGSPKNCLWVLSKAKKKEEAKNQLYQTALLTGNLDILSELEEKSKLVNDLFSPAMEIEQIKKEVRKILLNSSFENVKKILNDNSLEIYPSDVKRAISEEINDFFNWGPLVSLYQNVNHQDEINQTYQNGKGEDFYPLSYIEKQYEFGKNCEKIIQEAETRILSLSLRDLISFFVEGRKTSTNEKNERFFTFRNIDIHTPIGDRYAHFLPYIRKIFQKENFSNEIDIKYDEKDIMMTLYYKNKSEENLPLTKIYFFPTAIHHYCFFWQHTPPSSLEKMTPDLEESFKEIFTNNIIPKNHEDLMQLHQKISKFYWLGSDACLTIRGNAQYFQMLLQMAYRRNGCRPGIVSRKYPQFDCVAISTPLSEFQKRYLEFFEVKPTLLSSPGTLARFEQPIVTPIEQVSMSLSNNNI